MKDSTATINLENGHTINLKGANPQQLGTAASIIGRIKYLKYSFAKFVAIAPLSVIDVGANIGTYSLLFNYFWPKANIMAIEPSSYNRPYLDYNLGHIPNIEIHQMALGSKRSTGELAVPLPEQKEVNNDYWETHTGTLSLYGKSENLREKVEIYPLDELDISRPVNFMKIDVEGHELEVLRGARETIKEDKPNMLIEVHNTNIDMAGTTKNQLFRYLAGLGYFPFRNFGIDMVFRHVGIGYILDRLDYSYVTREE
jgi:FkbM family methyltransferase